MNGAVEDIARSTNEQSAGIETSNQLAQSAINCQDEVQQQMVQLDTASESVRATANQLNAIIQDLNGVSEAVHKGVITNDNQAQNALSIASDITSALATLNTMFSTESAKRKKVLCSGKITHQAISTPRLGTTD